MKKELLFGLVVIGLLVYYLLTKNPSKEHYEPRDMGSRHYWGFGREYAYSFDDTKEEQNFCYLITPDTVCMPGYKHSINPETLGNQCCVYWTNYGK